MFCITVIGLTAHINNTRCSIPINLTEQAGYTGPEGQKTLDPMSSKAATKGVFAWTKHWYPVMLVSDLDAQNPTPHTLLNISMVVWQDGEGNWGACEDRCPHRSAATQLPCGTNLCGVLFCFVLEVLDIHRKTLLQTTQLYSLHFTISLGYAACLDAWPKPTQSAQASSFVD